MPPSYKQQLVSARHEAHQHFDRLWRRGPSITWGRRRTKAYRWLAAQTGLSIRECHIRFFDLGMCEAVIKLCREVEFGVVEGPNFGDVNQHPIRHDKVKKMRRRKKIAAAQVKGSIAYMVENYQESASRTESPHDERQDERLTDNRRLIHACLGLSSECGELAAAVWDHIIDGKPLDEVNVVEECGDLLWYAALAANAIGRRVDDLPHCTAQPNPKISDASFLAMAYTLKLAKHAGEVADIEKRIVYYGLRQQLTDLLFAIGSIVRLVEDLAALFKVSLAEVKRRNIAKLQARYPERFSSDRCENRDLEKERRVLEREGEDAA